jgi:hypothetical protein
MRSNIELTPSCPARRFGWKYQRFLFDRSRRILRERDAGFDGSGSERQSIYPEQQSRDRNINRAKPGEAVIQPGLVDTAVNCTQNPGDAVATFTRTIKLNFGGGKNTIDAAIAAVMPGNVNAEILNIGGIASAVATPRLGLTVQKMGRTTCLTEGRIKAVSVNVDVSYSALGGGVAKFVDQIEIAGIDQTFASAGDSGSLIVTQDSCPRAVALLFAGTSSDAADAGVEVPTSATVSPFSTVEIGLAIVDPFGTHAP